MARIEYTAALMAQEARVAERVFKHLRHHDLFRDQILAKGRDGAVFTVTLLDGRHATPIPLGFLDTQERNTFLTYGLEKCQRLAQHGDHAASRESRDEEQGQYPGAVRCTNSLRSVSGWSSDLDELAAVLWAVEMGDLDVETARQILEENPEYRRYIMAPNGFMK